MKFIRYNLWRARRSLSASSEFKKSLWARLESEWNARQLPNYNWYQKAWLRLGASGLVGIIFAGTIGTSVYAYNNPQITEGTPLYPLKQAIEAIEEKISTRNPEAHAKFLLKKVSRREAEKAVMQNRQKDSPNKDLQNVESKINNLDKELETTDKELKKTDLSIHKEIEEHLQKRKASLKILDSNDNKNKDSSISTTSLPKDDEFSDKKVKIEDFTRKNHSPPELDAVNGNQKTKMAPIKWFGAR